MTHLYKDFISSSMLSYLVCFALIVLIAIARAKWMKLKLKLKDLDALGFYRSGGNEGNERKIKVYFSGRNKLIFSVYNRSYDLQKFISMRDKLEHVYQRKIHCIESRRWLWFQARIIVVFEHWNESFSFKHLTVPTFGSFLVGKDGSGREVYQSFHGGENSLFLGGQKGSGKSQALCSLIHSFFLNDHHRQQFDLIVIDAKLSDYLHFKEIYRAKIYDVTIVAEFKAAIQEIRTRCSDWESLKNENNSQDVQVRNYLDYKGNKPKNFMLVIDEASQSLGYDSLKPPHKDASQQEKAEYEYFLLKKEFAALLNNILAVHRFYGNCVFVASQSCISSEYMFSFTNLRTMLLSRGSSSQNSLALTGDSQMLLDKDLKLGRWIYISNNGIVKVQTALSCETET